MYYIYLYTLFHFRLPAGCSGSLSVAGMGAIVVTVSIDIVYNAYKLVTSGHTYIHTYIHIIVWVFYGFIEPLLTLNCIIQDVAWFFLCVNFSPNC